jgi:hypothetical protein
MNPQVLIGGPQSTGSSLLVNILDRHSAVSAGPETYLFMHPRLYTGWNRYKKYLLRTSKFGGLKSEGWFLMNGAQLRQEEYGWREAELKQLVEAATNLPTFAGAYFSRRMERTGARLWAEKSPANVTAFPQFLDTFPNPKVIHTTRDPYDAAASLVARGYSPYYAAGAYVVHTALALRAHDRPDYHWLKYERLALQPRETVDELLAFLQLPWEEILDPGPEEQDEEVRLRGWLQNERGPIGVKSLGRFQRLPRPKMKAIVDALALFRINPAYARRHGIRHTSLREVCAVLDYPYLEAEAPDRRALLRQRRRDRWRRVGRFYAGFGAGYGGGVE